MPHVTAADGTKLYYRDWGQGDPVVLIHGWPLNGDMWERQSTYLAENGYRVLVYDRRGFGRSDQPWDGYDYTTFASDLHALMEQADLRRAALVGFSMGGGEVVRYLATHGGARVRCAALVSSVTPYLQKTADNPHGVDPSVFADMRQKLTEDRPAFLESFAASFFGRTALSHKVSEAVLDWAQFLAFTGSYRATLAAADAWSMTDFRKDMAAIDVPVRVIHGDADKTVPIDASAKLSVSLLKNATLSIYEGEPHGLFWTAAERLNRELFELVKNGG